MKSLHAERRVDSKIASVLVGGTLLVASILARAMLSDEHAAALAALAALFLATPILLECARDLLARGREDRDSLRMRELVVLAVVASFATGKYLESGAISFFLLLASLIEDRTAIGARKTIESLVRITPRRAARVGESGEETEVDALELRPGDHIVVRPGDAVGADGVIESGESALVEANVTGESLPVEKGPGDEIFAGTINETGVLRVRVTHAGHESTLGQVQKLILEAAASRPESARLLDRYAAYYLPVVLGLATLVLFFTREVDRAISLLLIACPAAIVLSGPTAIVAALGAATRLGVLVKKVSDMETARRITAIVLDKTGTLTTGKLEVTRLAPVEGVDPARLLAVSASAEQDSKHPIARAILESARATRVPIHPAESLEEVAGRGVRVKVRGLDVRVGRRSFLESEGVDLAGVEDPDSASSQLWVAEDLRLLGWIGLEDSIREDAQASIAALAALGVERRVLVTGDRRAAAERVAARLEITDCIAEALPGQKLEIVEELKRAGHVVAVVGDGVNDGPALAAGHVSIAMGAAGSDVAIHSATIALMSHRLDRLPFLVRLSERTVAVMRQNLVGVGLYAVTLFVLFGLGWMTPLLAALANGASSVLVVLNSARLVREGEELTEARVHAAPPGAPAPAARAAQLTPSPGGSG